MAGRNGSQKKRKGGRVIALESQKMREKQRAERRAFSKAKAEFRDWRRTLCRIIQTESEMVRKEDGSYIFYLPPKITQIVHEVTLREYMALRGSSREEAESAVRRGFVKSAEAIDKLVGESKREEPKSDDVKGEEDAKRALEEMRAEVVGMQGDKG